MRLPAGFSAVSLAAALLSGCATGDIPDIQPGQRPALDSDEAGLWMTMDKAEEDLMTSGRVERDPVLNDYVREVLCKIEHNQCKDIRLYIVNVPNFNASMGPNGVMQVWTGALLRFQNEAQMAYVLGHEMGHFQRRHSLKRWRDMRAKFDFLPFFRIAAAVGGVGFVGDIASIAVVGSIFSYSREHEREADEVGFELAVAAGYDPREAANIWHALKAEKDAGEEPKRSAFFATHPGTEERIDTLTAKAEAVTFDPATVVVGAERYRSVTRPFRHAWLRAELRKHNYEQSMVVLEELAKTGEDLGLLTFLRGEVYRLRDGEGDLALAAGAYEAAAEMGGEPAETYRSLGLVAWKQGRHVRAEEAFAQYLDRAPEASDRAIVESYLSELREVSS